MYGRGFVTSCPESCAAQLDVDGDGFLSAEELQRGLRDCDIFANVEDICQLMEEHAIDSEERERHLISAQSFQVRAHAIRLTFRPDCHRCSGDSCQQCEA